MIFENFSVAILLAAYNGKRSIAKQLQTIFLQCSVDITVFISVDRSSDGTEQYVFDLVNQYPKLKILSTGESFGSAGANFFRLLRDVSFEEFDYVAFADQDDIWTEDKLIRAINALDEKKANVYSSNVTAFWESGREMLIDKAQPQMKWDHHFEAAGPGCTYVMQAAVANQLKAIITQEADAMNGIELHDWFIYAWARHNGLRWFIDPVPSMRYRQHATNVIGVNKGLAAAKSRFNKLNDGWYLNQIMLISTAINAVDVMPIQWIKNPSLLNKFKLLVSVSKCRRRFRDRLGFIVFILMLRQHEK
ncbi:glycosyltransferase [Deefgea salmonis]|uniref:Glycosyltransferase n=1 Tax=Deefgea salmonis TaxID=2875502 RepID=A0ABS8BK57_9NEIS|nr:glycosyltransferase [Deefgea salmonis]MCB5196113.1 glycosyltransferase [Deefgea salmonis]